MTPISGMGPDRMRRRLLLALAATPALGWAGGPVSYAVVKPRPLAFPRDHGSHPDYRIEWWYLTGWLDAEPQPLGLQVTFFRARTSIDPANPSRFAAHQLIIAHAAIADPTRGALLKDERVARAGLGLAWASESDTDVTVHRWTFRREPDGGYSCSIPARGFELQFTARPSQPLLLQGQDGFSRKGPRLEQASHYYSTPHLVVEASLRRDGRIVEAQGSAWLDHEWSSTLLDPSAAGWDWVGMNLDDGSALTAFQIRANGTGAPIYGYASLRGPDSGLVQTFAPEAVAFEPLARWTSPRTGAVYPVAQRIRVGDRLFATEPLFADQELDSRASAGAVYWEGASRLREAGRLVGRGYLEMTGYAAPMRL
ncbi:MAG: lipocalin-like domain-containing protein [Bdellovibrio bacteriovorus]